MTQPTELQKKINHVVLSARKLEVTSAQDLEYASQFLAACNQRLMEINDAYDSIIQKNFEAHRNAVAIKRAHSQPVENAKQLVSQKVNSYQAEQARIVREKAAEAAQKAREEVEAQKKAEADQVEAEGYKEEAEAIRQEERPITVITPAEPVEKPPEGMSFREYWKIKVIDLKKLIAEAPDYVIQDQKALNAAVRARKGNCKIPGCKIWCERKVQQRKK